MSPTISSFPYQGEAALSALVPFLRALPEGSYHLTDLAYRFSSPKMQDERNARVWQLADGRIVGLAAWQYYWAMLDYFVLPGPWQQDVEQEIFSWALDLFREMDRKRRKPLPYWVEYREDDSERQARLQKLGFDLDADYHHIRLRHDLTEPLAEPRVAPGFHLRPLAGAREVEGYTALHQAAFESESMTPEWRARTLRMPHYQPELDLVAVAEDGTLAGFCIGWFNEAHQIGQIEPLGIHPHYQRRGLGRALLLELLRRFKAHGARYAIVEPVSSDSPAVQTYEAVGFYPYQKLLLKGKWVSKQE